MSNQRSDPKKAIIMILEDLGEATTAEIVDEATAVSNDCKDRVPHTLVLMEKDHIIKRNISKVKKAIVWSLALSKGV